VLQVPPHDPRDKVLGQHRWTQSAADTVVLDFDDRHRRRMAMTGTRGLEFLLDLENAIALRGGDALVLEDGRLIEVVAAPEPLIEIRGADPLHWFASPGISATAICRPRSCRRAFASAGIM
jgi:urease accessory protein UreE